MVASDRDGERPRIFITLERKREGNVICAHHESASNIVGMALAHHDSRGVSQTVAQSYTFCEQKQKALIEATFPLGMKLHYLI